MAALYLVNKAHALTGCLEVAASRDTVLLLEDGVYAGVAGVAPQRPLLVLEPDVTARGLRGRLAGNVTTVTDAGFVALVADHQPIVTWR